MTRFISLLVALAATVNVARAQSLEVRPVTAPSGLKYLHVLLPEAPTQSLQLLWKDTSPQSTDALPGLPLAAQYLMAREPKGEILGELIETLRDQQAGFNISIGTNAAGLSISSPKEHFEAAVLLIKRFLDDPALPQDRLDIYRHDSILHATRALRQGDVLANQLRTMALLPDGALRKYHLVDPLKLDNVRADDVEKWRKTLARDRMLVVTAGPLTPAELDGTLTRLVDRLPQTAAIKPAESIAFRNKPVTLALEAKVPQTIIQAFGPTTIASGPESIKATMAIARLGGGAQGRLHAALRDALGATYGASANLDSFAWGMTGISLRAAVQHDKASAALDALKAEYARWWRDGVTEAEFAAIRSNMLGNRYASRRAPGGVAVGLINAVARGWPEDYYNQYDKALEAITRDEVNSYIRQHFPGELSVIIVAPDVDALSADCKMKQLRETDQCGL